MKITDLNTKRRKIDEMYSVEVSTASGYYDLVKVFAEHNKLTGNITEDAKLIYTLGQLMEEDEDFDPFGHLIAADKIDVEDDCVLTLNSGNDKMQHMSVVYLSLPAGYTCPFAKICKSTAHKKGGRFKDNNLAIKDFGDIRCYAASAEVAYPNVRKARWRNYDLLRKFKNDVNGMAKLIVKSLAFYEQKHPSIKLFRIHESGDFWSQEYFDAWIKAARARPDILFYAYTKALPLWKERKDEIPDNLRLIASEGGTHDDLIDKEQFRKAIIVQDQGEAIRQRLHIDANDFLAAFGDQDFALLMHGVQSKASGNTRQSSANSKILKNAAKNLKIPPGEIERLLLHYTRPGGKVQIPVQIGESSSMQSVNASISSLSKAAERFKSYLEKAGLKVNLNVFKTGRGGTEHHGPSYISIIVYDNNERIASGKLYAGGYGDVVTWSSFKKAIVDKVTKAKEHNAEISDSVGDTQNVGDGYENEIGAKWTQPDMPFGMHS